MNLTNKKSKGRRAHRPAFPPLRRAGHSKHAKHAERATQARDPWLIPANPPRQFDIRGWKSEGSNRKRFEIAVEVEDRGDTLANVLDNGSDQHRQQANRLRHCWEHEPCNLSFCPICIRSFRINLVYRVAEQLQDDFKTGNLWAVTLVAERDQYPTEQLHQLNKRNIKQELRDTLRSAGLGRYSVIAGLHISYNEHAAQLWEAYWQMHWHTLFTGMDLTRDQLRQRLSRFYPATEAIPRPIKIERVYDLLGAVSYMYPPFFERRVSIIDGRGRKNVLPPRPLKPDQQRELALVLSELSFTDRLFLRGYRRRGQLLVRE